MKLRLLAFSLAVLAGPLVAQGQMTCSVNGGVPKVVRAEGKTELVADVVVECSGGSPTNGESQIPDGVFTLVFNAPVTSRILAPVNQSEVLVLLDEPLPFSAYACVEAPCFAFGNGEGSGYYGPGIPFYQIPGHANVHQATASGSNVTVTTPVDPPGEGTRTFRFTNIRLDASTVSGNPLRLLSISNTAIPTLSAPGGITLGTVQTGLVSSVRDAANATAAPNGVPIALATAGAPATLAASLRFSTGLSAAKARTIGSSGTPENAAPPVAQSFVPSDYFSESGYYNPNLPGNLNSFDARSAAQSRLSAPVSSNIAQAGLADWGTRLMATFTNVPPNVTIYVSVRDAASAFNGPAARLTSTDANGAGVFSGIAGNGTYAQLTPVNGVATAVWEVTRNFSSSPTNFDFGVYVSYPASIYPAPSPITVKLGFAPLTGGIPSFAAATGSQALFSFTSLTPPPPPVNPVLSVSPGSLTFAGTAGGTNPPAQLISVNGSPGQLPYSISGGGVLPFTFQPTSGTTPGSTAVSVLTRGLAAGTYRDVINVIGPQSTAPVAVTLILAPGPVITSLSPATTVAGTAGFTLSVSGTNLTRGTAVLWNGAPLATTFVSTSQLTAEVSAALVARAGEASVAAFTPEGATSNSLPFTIVPFVLSSISPQTVRAGSAFTLTATGSGFLQGATVNIGGTSVTPATFSSTQLTASVPASVVPQAGPLSVTVNNPGGVASNAVTLTVTEAPVLTRIAPDTVTATARAFPLTLTGTGFATTATVQVGSLTLTGSGSRTQITVTVPAEAIAQAGSLAVRVVNSAADVSNSLPLTVAGAPRITLLTPSAANAGAAGSLTVTGVNFTNTCTVQWNGQPVTTSFVSSTELRVQLTAELTASAGTVQVSVVSNDGVTSNTLPFTINPAITITSLNPATVNAGSGAFTLTVNGSNIPSGASVALSGQTVPTTFVSASQVTAQVPAAMVSSVGSFQVSVRSLEGAASNSLPLNVVLPPLPGVGFTAPPAAPSGGDQAVTLTLGGVFPVDLRVTVTLTFTPDGTLPDDPAIQFSNGSRTLTFTIPAGTPAQIPALLMKTGTVAGTITITVAFLTATGENVTPGTVTPQRITVGRTAPSITSMTCARNSTGFTVTIDGFTNTREATTATFDFTAVSGASLGTTQLVVPAGSLFTAWFGSGGAGTTGGVFRYTQPFTVQGNTTGVAGLTARLGNAVGASAAASCQLQ